MCIYLSMNTDFIIIIIIKNLIIIIIIIIIIITVSSSCPLERKDRAEHLRWLRRLEI